jgi:hypothetical protein
LVGLVEHQTAPLELLALRRICPAYRQQTTRMSFCTQTGVTAERLLELLVRLEPRLSSVLWIWQHLAFGRPKPVNLVALVRLVMALLLLRLSLRLSLAAVAALGQTAALAGISPVLAACIRH